MNEVPLKEYIEAILAEKDKALTAALVAVKEENRKSEVAAEKRFDLLNELRSGVATKDEVKALEKIVDDLKTSRDLGQGKNSGINASWGLLVSVVALISVILGIIFKFI